MEITNEGKALICVGSSSAEDLLAEIQQTPIGIDAQSSEKCVPKNRAWYS